MTFHSLTDSAHLGAQSYFAARQSLHDPRRSCVIGPPRARWDVDAREFLSVVPIQVRERDKKERFNGNRNFEGAECSLLDEMYLPWFRITVGTTRAVEGSDHDVSRLVQKKMSAPAGSQVTKEQRSPSLSGSKRENRKPSDQYNYAQLTLKTKRNNI